MKKVEEILEQIFGIEKYLLEDPDGSERQLIAMDIIELVNNLNTAIETSDRELFILIRKVLKWVIGK